MRAIMICCSSCLSMCSHCFLFFLQCYLAHRNLHSFPTRRSSDLHSREDDAHSLRSVDLLERQLGSTVKEKLILDNSYHVITVDYQKERVAAEVIRFFQRFAENRSAVS